MIISLRVLLGIMMFAAVGFMFYVAITAAVGKSQIQTHVSYEDEYMRCVDFSGGYDGHGYFERAHQECLPKNR